LPRQLLPALADDKREIEPTFRATVWEQPNAPTQTQCYVRSTAGLGRFLLRSLTNRCSHSRSFAGSDIVSLLETRFRIRRYAETTDDERQLLAIEAAMLEIYHAQFTTNGQKT
jgi:hypothetical protein